MESKIKIVPLGGLGLIGMNITAIEYNDTIVVIDCGLAFPEDDMLGIDLVIPDITYLINNEEKVKGFVITHGHEDHIGALPYILKQLNVPVYGTNLTIALVGYTAMAGVIGAGGLGNLAYLDGYQRGQNDVTLIATIIILLIVFIIQIIGDFFTTKLDKR